MSFPEIRIFGLAGIKEIVYGERIADLIVEAIAAFFRSRLVPLGWSLSGKDDAG